MIVSVSLTMILLVAFCNGVVADEPAPIVAGYARYFRAAKPPVEGGMLLIAELNCTACHNHDTAKEAGFSRKQAPILDGAGIRLSPGWLRDYLNNPAAAKPGTTMPDIFANVDASIKKQKIESLVHFLMSRNKPLWPKIKPKDSDDLIASSYQRGFDLYHQVGCVACHDADPMPRFAEAKNAKPHHDLEIDPATIDVETVISLDSTGFAPSIPHGELSQKYHHESLASFLLDPLRGRPSGRMPDLKLSILEAADIAHYLLGGRLARPRFRFEVDEDLVQKGKTVFQRDGCANCHELQQTHGQLVSPKLIDLVGHPDQGCLAENKPTVDYRLNVQQRRAIRLAVAAMAKQPTVSQDQLVGRSMLQFNCYACHSRTNSKGELRGGVGTDRWDFFKTQGNVDFGDEGRIPPSLSRVGSKLTRDALTRIFQGDGDVRPHMLARMPKFGLENVGHLTDAFFAVDGGRHETETVSDESADKEAGRQLMSFGCVQCHPLNGRKMAGVIGIDLANLQDRLQPEWFREFLLKPGSVKPRTRMPTFFTGGQSVVTDVLDGDADRQIAALWAYLKRTEKAALPDKLANVGNESFELVPKDEPILLRTFMREAGTHAVAVGFPEKVHFAFDAEKIRLAIGWKGRFLDAHGTWFDRFTPPAEPLSDVRISFPSGSPLATLADRDQPWPNTTGTVAGYRWLGFRLDKKGIPTFLYTFGNLRISERMTATKDGQGLRRAIACQGPDQEIWFRVWSPEMSKAGATYTIVHPKKEATETADGIRIPLLIRQGSAKFEVEYRW